MRRLALALFVLLLGLHAPSEHARAQGRRTVGVEVVDLGGGRAFVRPGEDEGIRAGTTVTIGGREYVVTAATRTSAVLEVGDRRIEVGDRGSARVETRADEASARALPEVVPLARYDGQWTEAPRPASVQTPDYVPLGRTSRDRRVRMLFSSATTGYIPLQSQGDALVREYVRGRVHAEPVRNVPFAIDADATVQIYAAQNLSSLPGSASRPLLRVQQLSISYGREREFFAAMGRMQAAATNVAMLDGVRLRAPAVRGVSLGAYGGFSPGLFNNAPSVSNARFGIDATYSAPEHPLRPVAGVVAEGSVYDGAIDERRLQGFASITPGRGRAGGYLVVDWHDKNNPWNASRVEVQAAGVEGSIRAGRWQGGARFDYRRPERTNWLASQLPTSWLCGGLGTEANPCQVHRDGRLFASGDTSLRVGEKAVLAAGGSYVRTPAAQTSMASGFVQLRLAQLADVARLSLTAQAYAGSLLVQYAVAAEFGAHLLGEKLDLSAHYRPSIMRYAADVNGSYDHLFGAAVRYDPRHDLSTSLAIDAFVGHDLDAMLVQLVVAYRPDVE
ncbi:MAG: hypothetical protein U0230_13415 [Polyangiales bacterium]